MWNPAQLSAEGGVGFSRIWGSGEMPKEPKIHDAELVEHFEMGYALTEAQVDREAGVLRDVALLGSVSQNNRRYSANAMKDAERLYQGARIFIDHPSDRQLKENRGTRSIRDLCGKVISARVVNGRVRGDVQIVGPERDRIFDIAESMPELIGHSHRARGKVRPDGQGGFVVESLQSVAAVELVSEPATTQGLFESVDHSSGVETMDELKEITEATLRAERPDLVEAIEKAAQLAADDGKRIADLQEQVKTLQGENDTLKAANAERERQALIESKLAAAKLPDTLVTEHFRLQLQEAKDEAAVDALIEDRKGLVKSVKPTPKPFSRERDPAAVLTEGVTELDEAKRADWSQRLFA